MILGKERLGEIIGPEKPVTAPKLISRLIEKHPEIIQISLAAYPPHSHGSKPGDYYREFLPASYESVNLAHGEWRKTSTYLPEVSAVGSVVTICPKESCAHSPRDHDDEQLWLWTLWHEGIDGPQGLLRSFVFLDIEYNRPEVLPKLIEGLREVDSDWYILKSGGGYHVIFDSLVDLESLIPEYGSLIRLFGERLNNKRLQAWGEDLAKNGHDSKQVLKWCEDVLQNCGHVDEPIYETGKEVHIIDLRHLAHSFISFERFRLWLIQHSEVSNFGSGNFFPDEIGGVYLRISPKREGGLVPVLAAQKENGILKNFPLPEDYFKNSGQLEMFTSV